MLSLSYGTFRAIALARVDGASAYYRQHEPYIIFPAYADTLYGKTRPEIGLDTTQFKDFQSLLL